MSDLTTCNHCDLIRYKAEAKKQRKVITLLEDTTSLLSGLDVYRHPKKVKIEELPKAKREQYHIVWFMSLTDHCVC